MKGTVDLMAAAVTLRAKLALAGNNPEVVRKLDAIITANAENRLSVNDVEKCRRLIQAHH